MAEELDDDVLEEVDQDGEDTGGSKLAVLKRLFTNRIFLISIIAVFVILIAVASYFIFFSKDDEPAPETTSEMTDAATTEQEQTTSDTTQKTGPSLSDISGHLSGTTSEQTDEMTSAAADGEKPSRISKISQGMVEAAKTGGIVSTDNSAEGTDASAEQMPVAEPTAESKLLSDLLAEKVAELEEENKQLKEQIEKLEIQIKLYKNTQRAESLSVPVEQFGMGDTPSNGASSTLYNDGLINDFSHDYSASPYADDEMTPKPSWGETKPNENK